MLAGKQDDALALYAAILEQSRHAEFRTEARFQTAQIRMLQGNYREAAALYLDILNHSPGLARVRLELARAYFYNRDYEDARFQFELVKGGDLPPEVLEKADQFLALIRRQKNHEFNVDLALVPDSNISQASGGDEECVATIFGPLCRPLEKKRSGLGLNAGATLDHYLRFSRDFGLRSTVGLSALEYEARDYDDYQAYLASGPRLTFESGESSLQPTFRKRWHAGKQYSEEYGLRWDARKIWGRLLLDGGASWAQSRYNESAVNAALRGANQSVFLQPRYILDDQTFVQAGLAFLRDNTRIAAYGSDSRRYSLGAYHFFPYGFSLFGELSRTDARHHDTQWYVTRDRRIDETRRRDRIWQGYLALSSNLLDRHGLTPSLQYTYTRRDSNIWSREYDRHRVTMFFNYKF
jgi:tetratricopeptide (TPR) repeat protein